MLTAAEFARNGYGAWRLLLGDARGLDWLDRSPSGAWRSFRLSIVMLPLYLPFVWLDVHLSGTQAPLLQILIVELSSYAIGWTLMPLVMLYLAPRLQREKEYVGFVVAYNWATLILVLLALPIVLLVAIGFPIELVGFFQLLLNGLVLFYGWNIFRISLRLSPLVAAAFELADFVISVAINQITDALMK
jgi:hypothetical protein